MTYAATAAWLRPRLWFGLVVGLVPWVVWLGSLALGGWYKDSEGTLIGADHLAFYTAAHLIRDGEAQRMYDYYELNNSAYEQRLIGWSWGGFEAYRNPPFYALLYVPTAAFSFYASMLIWAVLTFVALALAIRLSDSQRPDHVYLWSLAFYPVFATVTFGQNTGLSLLVFASVYRLLKTGRNYSAGLMAGLLAFKPQLLIGLFVWWLFAPRRYRLCWAGAATTGLALTGICWAALPDASEAFVRNLSAIADFRGFGMWNVDTPRAFFELLLPQSPPWNSQLMIGDKPVGVRGLVVGGCTLIVAVISLLTAWRLAVRSQLDLDTLFPVAMFLSLWLSPHALIYEWALLIPAGVVLWERHPRHRDAWICLFALVWLAFLVTTTLAFLQIKYIGSPCLQLSVPLMAVAATLTVRQLFRSYSLHTWPCVTNSPSDHEITANRRI